MKFDRNSITGTGNTIPNGNNFSVGNQNVRQMKRTGAQNLSMFQTIAHGRSSPESVRRIIKGFSGIVKDKFRAISADKPEISSFRKILQVMGRAAGTRLTGLIQ